DLTIALLRERLCSNASNGFVLDGFPRTPAQGEALDDLLQDLDRELDAILFFDVPDAVAVSRLLGRALEAPRADDIRETITRRLDVYHSKTKPVVEHYRVTGRLVPLHAERDADEVWLEIQDALDQVGSRAVEARP